MPTILKAHGVSVSSTAAPLDGPRVKETSVEFRIATLEATLEEVEMRLEEVEQCLESTVRASAKRVSDKSLRLLSILGTDPKASIRFADIVRQAIDLGIVEDDPAVPYRPYNSIHARMHHLSSMGLAKRTSWGRWTLTEAGAALPLPTGPGADGEGT